MDIDAVVSVERDVAVRLESLNARVHARLLARITALTGRLHADEVGRAPERTGKLRGEIGSSVDETPDLVRGRVFVDTGGNRSEHGKAAALEYGAHGTAAVKAFARQGHTPFGQRAEQMVAAYSRHLDIVEVSFARGALDDLRGEAKAAFEEALEGA